MAGKRTRFDSPASALLSLLLPLLPLLLLLRLLPLLLLLLQMLLYVHRNHKERGAQDGTSTFTQFLTSAFSAFLQPTSEDMKLYFITNSMIDWAHLNGQKTDVKTPQEFGFCITEQTDAQSALLRLISVSFCLP